MTYHMRAATRSDINILAAMEAASFSTDVLSQKQFKYYLTQPNAELWVAHDADSLMGYVLVTFRKGTRLARIYSLLVAPKYQGQGVGRTLIKEAQKLAKARHCTWLRLEVAVENSAAKGLYHSMGFRKYASKKHYYGPQLHAECLQKPLSQQLLAPHNSVPWYQQTTEFTCGPCALMMAMKALEPSYVLSQSEELAIWREATTIFMTQGHGGCHPVGLANAAKKRGFAAKVLLNTQAVLFQDGVRQSHKKHVLALVDGEFKTDASRLGVNIEYSGFALSDFESALQAGHLVLALISTYRLDGKKAPHWVCVTHVDETCVYLHDPWWDSADKDEYTSGQSAALDCHHLPIARTDFEKMASFGKQKLQACVVISL